MRNTIAKVFIHGYPEQIQSDNGIDLKSKILNAYLAEVEVKHLYESSSK